MKENCKSRGQEISVYEISKEHGYAILDICGHKVTVEGVHSMEELKERILSNLREERALRQEDYGEEYGVSGEVYGCFNDNSHIHAAPGGTDPTGKSKDRKLSWQRRNYERNFRSSVD